MIIEILLISLAEDCVKSCFITSCEVIIAGALISKMAAKRFVDFSEKKFTMKQNAIPKGTEDTSKSGVTLFEGKI